jgi:glucokinase
LFLKSLDADSYPRLLGDIGGTNARFAWQAGVASFITSVSTFACADYPSLQAVIQQYLSAHSHPQPRCCALGMANPITGDTVQMTNHHWSFSISALQKALGLKRLLVINDFTALALSLPTLSPLDLQKIGQGQAVAEAPVALIGPGTGLGVSGLFKVGSKFSAITGEGGHVSLAAVDDFEAAVVHWLQKQFGHASAERALSGPGLINLYRAVSDLKGTSPQEFTASKIVSLAKEGTDEACSTALKLFFSFLGTTAGNLALTLGARGGVYIGGGIVPRVIAEMCTSSFRTRFEGKGRFQAYLSDIPTFVIDVAVSPALHGAAAALDLEIDRGIS